jgi:hypothetical protein
VSLTVLAAIAVALLCAHRLVRRGTTAGGLSATESFLFGNWVFIVGNAVIVSATGGRQWTSLDVYARGAGNAAGGVVCLGLAAFVLGATLVRRPCSRPRTSRTGGAAPSASGDMLAAGLVMVVIGTAAAVANFARVSGLGRGEASPALIGLSQVLVPGVLFCWFSARERRLPAILRAAGLALASAGLTAMTLGWSRRPLLVAAAGVMFGGSMAREGRISRRRLLLALPVAGVLVVGTLVSRLVLTFGVPASHILEEGLVEFYLSRVWLEVSAFSALVFLVEEFGLWTFLGGESVVSAFLFWVPRQVFPEKPDAFDLRAYLGTPYTVGPSIYGELLVNFSVVGMAVAMALLGYLLKRIDLRWGAQVRSSAAAVVYVMFVFDTAFLPRGSFHAMAVPLMVHSVVPLLVLGVIGMFRSGVPVASHHRLTAPRVPGGRVR